MKLTTQCSEGLLQEFEAFLHSLKSERLSAACESRRLALLEKIEVSSLPPQPPPPRPTPDDAGGPTRKRKESAEKKTTTVRQSSVAEDGPGLYEDISLGKREPQEDNLYELPKPGTGAVEQTAKSDVAGGDSDSGTSYEDYDEDRFDCDDVYDNVDAPSSRQQENIALPRKRSVKRRYGGMEDIQFSGELSVKALLGTEKKACVIQGNKLHVFKSMYSKRAQAVVDLGVYEAEYSEREGRHQHVLRLLPVGSTGGQEYFFIADSRQTAHAWLTYMRVRESDGISVTSKDSSSLHDSGVQMESCSSSEGGSGDGVVVCVAGGTPLSSPPAISSGSGTLSKGKGERKKSLGGKLFDTFGRKAGKSAKLELNEDEPPDPNALVSGTVLVQSDALLGSNKWQRIYCAVRPEGTLEGFRRRDDDTPDFKIVLLGCAIEVAKISAHPLAFKLTQQGETKLCMEPPVVMEQGRWLNVLIKETEGANIPGSPENLYADVNDNQMCVCFANDKTSPPPLPTDPPPPSTPPTTKKRQLEVLIKKLQAGGDSDEGKSHDTAASAHQEDTELSGLNNPVLRELRLLRRGSGGAAAGQSAGEEERVEEELRQLQQEAREIREQRVIVRGHKLMCGDVTERKRLEEELRKIEAELEENQSKLTKVTLLKEEKNAASKRLTTSGWVSFGKDTVTPPSTGIVEKKTETKPKSQITTTESSITSKMKVTSRVSTTTDASTERASSPHPTATGKVRAIKITSVQDRLKLWESIGGDCHC